MKIRTILTVHFHWNKTISITHQTDNTNSKRTK